MDHCTQQVFPLLASNRPQDRRRHAAYPSTRLILVICVLNLGFPPHLKPQCTVSSGPVCMNGMCEARVHNTEFLPGGSCFTTSAEDAVCDVFSPHKTYGPASSVTWELRATATGADPRCTWSCCGISGLVRMTASDGLPVELMSFSIEDDASSADRESEGSEPDSSD